MQPTLPKQMAETLLKYQMLRKGSRVLVAFSGGADSLSLLCAFLEIKDEWPLEIAAAHLDHGLRGEDARADADWAESFCRCRGIAFFRGYWPGHQQVKAGRSPEEAARKARRRFLESTLEKWPGDVIALGHHLDDQAETVLIHLLHGAGLRGMGGMRPVQGPYIRPLLEINRKRILEYIAELGITPRFDATNSDPAYLRNRLRLQVVPILEENNPGFAAAACRMAELARREDDFLDCLAEKALEELDFAPPAHRGQEQEQTRLALWRKLAGFAPGGADISRIPLQGLIAMDPVIARRALRLRLSLMEEKAGPDMAGTERIYQLALSGRIGSRAEAGRGVRVRKERDCLVLEHIEDNVEWSNGNRKKLLNGKAIETQISPGGTVWLAAGKVRITARWAEGGADSAGPESAGKSPEEEPYDRYVCAWHAQGAGLALRCRREGDWLSMPYGRKKLKDMFIEKRIPVELRNSLPLLTNGGQVLWIPGIVKALGCFGNGAEKQVEFACYIS